MAFGAEPVDSNSIPISSVYVPGVGFIALKGSTNTNTDGSSNQSTAATMSGDYTESASLTAGSLNADLVASVDVSYFKWFSVQVTGTWSGTLTFQGSNDNTNFVSVTAFAVATPGTAVSTTTSNGIYVGPVTFRYLRIRMTAYTSGTANGTLEAYTFGPTSFGGGSGGGGGSSNITQFGGNNIATGTGASGTGIPRVTVSNDSTVGSNSPTGSAVPANAFYLGVVTRATLPPIASDGNLTGVMGDKLGRVVVITDTTRDLKSNITPVTLTSTTETTFIAATALTFHDINSIICVNTSASAVRVDFRDSTGGTIQFALEVPANDTRGFSNCFFKQTTFNNNWTVQLSAAVTDVRIYGTYLPN